MHWLNASPHFSTVELLELYSTAGELVDGLFLWLALVVTKTHVNFVHSDQGLNNNVDRYCELDGCNDCCCGRELSGGTWSHRESHEGGLEEQRHLQ